ncbi:MAG: Fic family protein [Firmicutes bacterium]|nr:Fic family protein [Bacillota bacterium]
MDPRGTPFGEAKKTLLETLLDEIDKKRAIIDSHRPLPEAVVRKLKEYLDVEWTYTSNAIEGSTITRQETLVILKHGLTVRGKPLVEHLEVVNHKAAIDFVEGLAKSDVPITELEIRQIHSLILKGIDDDNAGRYRTHQVYISGSKYVPPDPVDVPVRMREFAAWLSKARSGIHPVECAALAHLELVRIHPFMDGDGRTARLLMNLILMRHSYPIAIVRPEDRLGYYDVLEGAGEGNKEDFVILMATAVNKMADIYVKAIGQR